MSHLPKPKPRVSFPDGIGPPRKTITGVRMVNGKPEYTFSNYITSVPASAIQFNEKDTDLKIAKAKANCPKIHLKTEDVIDYNTYVKEQQGVIAREKELFTAMQGHADRHGLTEECMDILKELEETRARKNIPSKDWRPFQRAYTLPEYRTPAKVGAPAIEANLPY